MSVFLFVRPYAESGERERDASVCLALEPRCRGAGLGPRRERLFRLWRMATNWAPGKLKLLNSSLTHTLQYCCARVSSISSTSEQTLDSTVTCTSSDADVVTVVLQSSNRIHTGHSTLNRSEYYSQARDGAQHIYTQHGRRRKKAVQQQEGVSW